MFACFKTLHVHKRTSNRKRDNGVSTAFNSTALINLAVLCRCIRRPTRRLWTETMSPQRNRRRRISLGPTPAVRHPRSSWSPALPHTPASAGRPDREARRKYPRPATLAALHQRVHRNDSALKTSGARTLVAFRLSAPRDHHVR